jgi:hypothetical protein
MEDVGSEIHPRPYAHSANGMFTFFGRIIRWWERARKAGANKLLLPLRADDECSLA